MKDPVLELIQKIVYEVSGREGLTYDTDFVQDLGLSSFDIMNIVCALSLIHIYNRGNDKALRAAHAP